MNSTALPLISTDLATLSKFFKILEREGLTREHVDMVIQSPDLAKSIAKALGINTEKYLPTSFNPGGKHHFLLHTVMGVTGDESSLSEAWRETFDHYMVDVHFAELLSTRPQREIDMLVANHGLSGGLRLSYNTLASRYDITSGRVRQILQRAEGNLRKTIVYEVHRREMENFRLARPGDVSLEDLDFSERTSNCLKRANIRSLFELAAKSESDLFGITNMGQKNVDEVKAKLAEYGLSLKP